jgi:hypothetical protein
MIEENVRGICFSSPMARTGGEGNMVRSGAEKKSLATMIRRRVGKKYFGHNVAREEDAQKC